MESIGRLVRGHVDECIVAIVHCFLGATLNAETFTSQYIVLPTGADAPQPVRGASIPLSIERNIADWAQDTSRVSPVSSLDGYGSIAVSEEALFRDAPLVWALPFTGGDVLDVVFGQCLNLVQASDKGVLDGNGEGENLAVVLVMGRKYVNTDTTTQDGIARAASLSLGSSGMADVVYSPLLHEVSGLFTSHNQGRLMFVARHPIEREFSRFRYLRETSLTLLRDRHDELMNMSYVDFSTSEFVADNWMTRTLANKSNEGELTAQDMLNAKEVLRRKATIGLYGDMVSGARHFTRYMGLDNSRNGGKLDDTTLMCFQNAVSEESRKDGVGAINLNDEETLEGSIAWKNIMEKNKLDLELFLYSEMLYRYQIGLG